MDKMKKYKQLIKELPSKKVVFAFGRFNPPTTGHELLVKAVKKLATSQNVDHAIYASKTQDPKKNPLDVTKKVHYLNLMFQNTHFVAANPQERTFIEAATSLNKKYKNLIMVAGSDRIAEYEKILNKYNGTLFNFDTIQVVSAGERDPDSDDAAGMSGTKMRALASKGNYTQFKNGLPSSIRDIDGKRLMNDIRQGMGLDTIKEQLNLVKDDTREKYFRGEIYNVDDIVESADIVYKIIKRGSNHILLQSESGDRISKWIQDVQPTEREFMVNEELTNKTLRPSDKVKVARIIADMLGIEKVEGTSNPEILVNNALRRIKTKSLNPEGYKILEKMLTLATEVGIMYDKTLVPGKLKEEDSLPAPIEMDQTEQNLEDQLFSDMDLTDEQLDHIVDSLKEEDFIEMYEDGELAVIDCDTGEEIVDDEVNESALMEVLSRYERMRSKVRFARTKSKRQRRAQIAARTHASSAVVNKRARRLAIKLMKQRMLRGRDASKISVGEKERMERVLQRRKAVVGRVAMKLAPRVRQIEKARLSHTKFTAARPTVTF